MKICSLLLIIFLSASCSPPNFSDIGKLKDENSDLRSETEKLRTEIKELSDENEKRKKYVKIVAEIVDEVYRELNAIDKRYITLYSGELAGKGRTDWERRLAEMLGTIDQMKKLVVENRSLVMELELTRNENERFEKLVYHLQNKLDNKRNEINRLTSYIYDLREKNLKLREKNIEFQRLMFKNVKNIAALEGESKTLEREYNAEKEKNSRRYVILVTNDRLIECRNCTNELCIRISARQIVVLSAHLSGSYIKKKMRNRRHYTLEILDREKFWNDTQFLIVYCKL